MEFSYQFELPAAIEAVAAFHHSPSALALLTPPPLKVEIQRAPPLAEGSLVEFTLSFGPLHIPWTAYHTRVRPPYGFTDHQIEGPLAYWSHTHAFTRLADGPSGPRTRVADRLEIIFRSGLRHAWTRLFFSPPMLWLLFTYRRLAIKRALGRPESTGRRAA